MSLPLWIHIDFMSSPCMVRHLPALSLVLTSAGLSEVPPFWHMQSTNGCFKWAVIGQVASIVATVAILGTCELLGGSPSLVPLLH